MFKKTPKLKAKKPTIKLVKPPVKPIRTKPSEIPITESLKNKVLPHIIADFAQALKSLKHGESIRFGRLGTFKKTKREVNGYVGYQYSFKAHSLVK
ncbi:hypothetical protein BGZ65_008412, partial [Modicella reniformis]